MDDYLMLPVAFRGDVLEFPFRIAYLGFLRHFVVQIDSVEVHYETDDSGELRAIVPAINEIEGPLPEKELLEAVGKSISGLIS